MSMSEVRRGVVNVNSNICIRPGVPSGGVAKFALLVLPLFALSIAWVAWVWAYTQDFNAELLAEAEAWKDCVANLAANQPVYSCDPETDKTRTLWTDLSTNRSGAIGLTVALLLLIAANALLRWLWVSRRKTQGQA